MNQAAGHEVATFLLLSVVELQIVGDRKLKTQTCKWDN